ncbi:MAG: hypothetical protein CML56_06130 [Rhodobacteraceae bacterium]|nr:hypothetical protein [Paracoccaceae bacterium]
MEEPFNPSPPRPRRRRVFSGLRNSFLTGIVVIAPVGLTVWLIWTVIGWVDGVVLPFIPNSYHPENIMKTVFGNDTQVRLRGLGLLFFLIFTTFVGWLAKGLLGRSLIRTAEGLVNRMPVVRSIYSGVKQIAETVFAQADRSFEKACIIEYPRKGIWAIGFISTKARGEIKRRVNGGKELLSVFVPTTPNPTSGFLLFFPAEDIIELDMTVEDAAKLVISAGLVYPNENGGLSIKNSENQNNDAKKV